MRQKLAMHDFHHTRPPPQKAHQGTCCPGAEAQLLPWQQHVYGPEMIQFAWWLGFQVEGQQALWGKTCTFCLDLSRPNTESHSPQLVEQHTTRQPARVCTGLLHVGILCQQPKQSSVCRLAERPKMQSKRSSPAWSKNAHHTLNTAQQTTTPVVTPFMP